MITKNDAGQAEPTASEPVGLCLSGGGFRAMLFHTGALWRLNELGLLPRLTMVSSVSGGSITAGVLASRWDALGFESGVATRFESQIVRPIRRMAARTTDRRAIFGGTLIPGIDSGRLLARAYRRRLFGSVRVADLPEKGPRFVFNATDMRDGTRWWFYRGRDEDPPLALATAVAASSAFPPFLSPVLVPNPVPGQSGRIFLSDAGVYDNLGLDAVLGRCHTVLVSDGSLHTPRTSNPAKNWVSQIIRVTDVTDDQVLALRTRELATLYRSGRILGTRWSIRDDIADVGLHDALPAPHPLTTRLAEYPTRLARVPKVVQERLINWGYAISDAAMRRRVTSAKPPTAYPYPESGLA